MSIASFFVGSYFVTHNWFSTELITLEAELLFSFNFKKKKGNTNWQARLQLAQIDHHDDTIECCYNTQKMFDPACEVLFLFLYADASTWVSVYLCYMFAFAVAFDLYAISFWLVARGREQCTTTLNPMVWCVLLACVEL
jgi:hypothetical protein